MAGQLSALAFRETLGQEPALRLLTRERQRAPVRGGGLFEPPGPSAQVGARGVSVPRISIAPPELLAQLPQFKTKLAPEVGSPGEKCSVGAAWVLAENVAWLKQTGRRYLIGTPKSELRKWTREIAEAQDWKQVREGVEAKQSVGAGRIRALRLVPVRGAAREGEGNPQPICDPHRSGPGETAPSLGACPAPRRPRSVATADRPNARAQSSRCRKTRDALPSGLRLVWSTRPEWEEWARNSEGCYVLRTNIAPRTCGVLTSS